METSGPAAKPKALRTTGGGVSRRTAVLIGLCVWLVALPLVHGVAPWAISLLSVRHGWEAGRPALWNMLGLVPVFLGLTGLAWVMVAGFSSVPRLPERVKLGLTPVYLLTSGPFAWSRNPMYLSALALWAGWSLFYGSVAVATVWPGMWAVMTFIIVPREERSLEACFGETYLRYKQRVHRWLGRKQA